MVTIYRTTSLQTPSRLLLCSLALADLLLGLVAQPATALFYLSAFSNWLDIFCVSWVVMTQGGYSIGAVSFMTLAAMSVDRCLAIKIKNRYKLTVTKRRTFILIVVVWVFTATSMNTGLLFFNSKQRQYNTFIVSFILLLVISVSFSLAYCSLKKISVRMSQASQIRTTANKVGPMQDASPCQRQTTLEHSVREPDPSKRAQSSSPFNVNKYKKSLNTMLMILLLNLVVYLPLLCFSIAEVMVSIPRQHSIVYFQYNGMLMAFNSTLNPIFYLWRMKDLRRALKALLTRRTATNE
ncbi:beta-1 adrenergic receptor-like [Actinia tenebrosa]|uniref:Beta-1 adrenergic receptor-like n=1 Tax=Actinia tenebrosa TaxID=6105 RepID=A0A6P8H173_ACTTE|nr:beta-1 adrenergic receptor-like [Actinia tenebrosa]